jgi:hypothetical protein
LLLLLLLLLLTNYKKARHSAIRHYPSMAELLSSANN